MILLSAILVLVLLFLVSVLSALETAIVSTTPGRIQNKLSSGNMNAKILMILLKNKEKVISTLVIAISIMQTVSTTIATTLIIALVDGNHATIIASAIMSVMVIIFAEVIPKGIAVSNAEPIALKASKLIHFSMILMSPINYGLDKIFRLFCFIFRIKTKSDISADEEVRGVIEHYHIEGDVVKDDKDMLEGVLDLNKTSVSEIMTHRSFVISIDADLPAKDIVDKALKTPYTRIPLWRKDKDNIIGLLHIRDLLLGLYKNKFDFSKIKLENYIMKPWFIPENTTLSTQLLEFKRRKNHLAFVVDEYGDIMGIISLEDILEEIVGQIDDEHDKNKNNILKKSKNKYIIEGSTTIRDINRELDIDLPDDEAHTIAGLLMHVLEKLPDIGENITINNTKITVIKKDFHKITKIQLEMLN